MRRRYGRVLGAVLEYLRVLLELLYLATIGLVGAIRELCARWRRGRKAEAERKRMGRHHQGCVRIPAKFYRRPDPVIYSQSYLMSLGLAVTWENPDVTLLRGSLPVASNALDPDTEYEIVARIWNHSSDAPAVGLPVSFWYLSFGIGTVRTAIGEHKIDLPVKGAPGLPTQARMKWRTPAAPGHYCLQVQLDWPDDANPHNNLGQHNTQVRKLNSPTARFTFNVRNDTSRRRALRFEVDTYTLPPRKPCSAPTDRERGKKPQESDLAQRPDQRLLASIARVAAQHDRRAHPVPDGWSVELSSTELNLEAGEETSMAVQVTAPTDDHHGRQTFNVHAFDGDRLVGGVTLHAEG